MATREPVSPRLLNPGIPKDLETICLKCLEKEPAKRYSSAAAMAKDLECFLEDSPIAARPVRRIERGWRWCRRKPLVAGLTAAVVVALAVGFAGVWWQWRRAEQKAYESRRSLYGHDMLLAQKSLEDGHTGHAKELLSQYLPRKGEPDLRGWEWRYAWNRCRGNELFTLERQPSHVLALARSPDGRTLASGSGGAQQGVVLWDLANRKPFKTLPQTSGVRGLAFSRDGKHLFVGTTDGVVWSWNCQTWKRIPLLSDVSYVLCLRVSPDGKTLAVLGTRFLILWDLAERREVLRTDVLLDFSITGVAFSPDSSLLAYGKGDGTIIVSDPTTTRTIAELKGHRRSVSALGFSPTGSLLVSGGFDRTVRLWNVATGEELRRIGTLSGWVGCTEFTPDGRLLVVSGADQRIRILETERQGEVGEPLRIGLASPSEEGPEGDGVHIGDGHAGSDPPAREGLGDRELALGGYPPSTFST